MQFSEYPQNGPCPHLSLSLSWYKHSAWKRNKLEPQTRAAGTKALQFAETLALHCCLRLHFAPISLLKRTREEVHLSLLIPPPWKWKRSFSQVQIIPAIPMGVFQIDWRRRQRKWNLQKEGNAFSRISSTTTSCNSIAAPLLVGWTNVDGCCSAIANKQFSGRINNKIDEVMIYRRTEKWVPGQTLSYAHSTLPPASSDDLSGADFPTSELPGQTEETDRQAGTLDLLHLFAYRPEHPPPSRPASSEMHICCCIKEGKRLMSVAFVLCCTQPISWSIDIHTHNNGQPTMSRILPLMMCGWLDSVKYPQIYSIHHYL